MERKVKFIEDNINTISVSKRKLIVTWLKSQGVPVHKGHPASTSVFVDQLKPEHIDELYKFLVIEYNNDLIDFSDIGHEKKEYMVV